MYFVDKCVLVHLRELVPFGLLTEKNRHQRFVLMRIDSVSWIQSTALVTKGLESRLFESHSLYRAKSNSNEIH